jgi:gamma-glutamyltranspeptidase
MCSLEQTMLPRPRLSATRRGSIIAASAAAALVVVATSALFVKTASAAERPPVIGPHAAVSAGHPLTSAAALEVLTRGGNAFDAGVAALLVGGVVEQDN